MKFNILFNAEEKKSIFSHTCNNLAKEEESQYLILNTEIQSICCLSS